MTSKEDGKKGETDLYRYGRRFKLHNPTKARKSLEIMFTRSRYGQPPQSLTWTMDGLHEAFAEACGVELDAEEE